MTKSQAMNRIACLFLGHEWSWWRRRYDSKTFKSIKTFRFCQRCEKEQRRNP